jgi:heme/copper-type cytochrome/quinol oxidase subunit 4
VTFVDAGLIIFCQLVSGLAGTLVLPVGNVFADVHAASLTWLLAHIDNGAGFVIRVQLSFRTLTLVTRYPVNAHILTATVVQLALINILTALAVFSQLLKLGTRAGDSSAVVVNAISLTSVVVTEIYTRAVDEFVSRVTATLVSVLVVVGARLVTRASVTDVDTDVTIQLIAWRAHAGQVSAD